MSEKMIREDIPSFQFIKTEELLDLTVHDKFINWVAGEFDLYLMSDEDGLKVYFPNGWFSIRSFNNDTSLTLEIKIEGNSKTSCGKILNKLQNVYNRITYYFEINTSSHDIN